MVQVAEAATPDARRIVASASGALAAIVEGEHVLVYGLPKLTPFADIGVEGDVDVVFARAGAADRLIVISRSRGESLLHIVDPAGPTKLDEIKFRAAVRVLAVADSHLLISGGGATWLVDVNKSKPAANLLPIRTTIAAAGRLGSSRFLIAAGSAYEEWDALIRKPVRRLRLDQVVEPLFVGGNDRRIWIVPGPQADRIEVVRFDAPRSRSIELGEPVSRVVPHARGDVVLAVGARTHSIFAVYLGRTDNAVVRLDRTGIVDAAWLGDSFTAVLRPLDGPPELLGLPAYVREPDEADEVPRSAPPPPQPTEPEPEPQDLPSTRWSREEVNARLAAWRTRVSQKPPEVAAPDPVALSRPRETGPEPRVHPGGWRGELASWARAVCAGSPREAPTLDCDVLDEVAERLQLEGHARHALMLLYGASLCGNTALTPVELASVLDWQWAEALGAGQLAATHAVQWKRGRVRLRDELHAALDERPAIFGTVIDSDERWDGAAVAIVAPADVDLATLGAWIAPQIGKTFVPSPRGESMPQRMLAEAKLRGALPLVRASDQRPDRAAIVAVETEEQAVSFSLSVVATWSQKIHGA